MKSKTLKRQIGLKDSVWLGLGSIIGTGVFVSLGLATGIAGPSVILAIFFAALVATCNGLSSAQLAAAHPVSGGTYEYGHQFLTPSLGFLAGWMFLCAKSASAATAALGFSSYLLQLGGISSYPLTIGLALASTLALTVVVLFGIRPASKINSLIVLITLSSLGLFVVLSLPKAFSMGQSSWSPFLTETSSLKNLFHATALMFVAYTGYGRIATLGEEVHHPEKTIPKAIIITLITSAVLYILVAAVSIGAHGANTFFMATLDTNAPLETLLHKSNGRFFSGLITVGAMMAMIGVQLNLILGLSRVLLAMGRRNDAPSIMSHVSSSGKTPTAAVITIAVIIMGLIGMGSIKLAWSFSAFTVLVYYAITNLSAIKLPAHQKTLPHFIPVLGFIFCLSLAFFVESGIWMAGLLVIGAGFLIRGVLKALPRS